MSKEKRRVPKLRFPGFTEDWEQYRFNNLLKKNLERNDGKFNSNKTISIARMKYNKLGNGASDESLNNYKVLRFGDVAFEGHENKEFKFGRFVMNDIGDGIMSPRFTALRPIKLLDVEFWKEYINYEPIMQKKLVNSTKKGTMMHELVVDEFLKQEILLPSKEEQQKIGRLLKLQSNIINLHQCKVEHLILMKKALLQKLFPRNGNRYPDFRFPGFTAPWEQCKLESLGKIITGNTPSTLKKEYWSANSEGVVWITPTDINSVKTDCSERLLTEEGASQARIVPANSILVTCIASIGKNTINTVEAAFNQQINALVPHLSNSYFILTMLNNMESAFKRVAGTSATSIINKKEFGQLSALLPSVEEQNKIGEIFELIDKSITLHQRKLEHLQIQKKSLLQQLFV